MHADVHSVRAELIYSRPDGYVVRVLQTLRRAFTRCRTNPIGEITGCEHLRWDSIKDGSSRAARREQAAEIRSRLVVRRIRTTDRSKSASSSDRQLIESYCCARSKSSVGSIVLYSECFMHSVLCVTSLNQLLYYLLHCQFSTTYKSNLLKNIGFVIINI